MKSFRKPISALAVALTMICAATPGVNAKSANSKIPAETVIGTCKLSEPRDLVLLIDQSASLNEPIEAGQTKQEKLIEALINLDTQLFSADQDYLREYQADGTHNLFLPINVGIIQFAGEVQVLRDLDKGPLRPGEFKAVTDLLSRNSSSLQGGTNYLDAIGAAMKQFSNSSYEGQCQSIVWFTDGQLNLGTNSPLDEANRLTQDFCGTPGSNVSASTSQLLRIKNIQTFVIFLAKQSDLPKRRLKSESAKTKEEKESIGFFDSIESLRAIAGDWSDDVNGQNVEKAAINQQCGSFNDNHGELIFVEKSEDLIYQLIVGASDCITTSQSLRMPSARLIKRLVVYFEGTGASGSLIESPPSLVRNAPPEGSKIVLGQDDLKDQNGEPFSAGWEIRFGANFQTCIGLEWEPAALQIKGTPDRVEYSALETDPIRIKLDLGEFVADVEDISDTDAIVGSAATVSGTNQIDYRPTSNVEEINQMPGRVRLIPKGVDQAIKDKLLTKPILATVVLSKPVVVTGADDVPVLVCGETAEKEGEDLLLSFRHIDGELSEDILTSNSKCSISNLKSGVIEVKWKSEPRVKLSENGRWVMRSESTSDERMLTFDSSEADARDFDLAYSEAVDGEYIPQSDYSSALEVQWSNNGATLITWKINVFVDVDLKKPADRAMATLFALLISLIAGLFSYLLLYAILWKTAIVGKPGQVRYRVERRTVGRNFSTKDIEIDSSIVSTLKPTSGDNSSRSLSAGEVQLSANIAPMYKPWRVLRGAWAEISSSGLNIAVRPRGPEASSTTAPLSPAVIARLVTFQMESDKYEIEYTFLLPNGNADLAGLINAQREVTKEVIDKAGSSSFSKDRPTKARTRQKEKSKDDQVATIEPQVLPTLPTLPFRAGGAAPNRPLSE